MLHTSPVSARNWSERHDRERQRHRYARSRGKCRRGAPRREGGIAPRERGGARPPLRPRPRDRRGRLGDRAWPVGERLQRVEGEAASVRIERGQRCAAAHVRHPGSGRDRRGDLRDDPVGDAEEDELRFALAERYAPLGEAPRDGTAHAAARTDDVDTLDHVAGSSSLRIPGSMQHTASRRTASPADAPSARARPPATPRRARSTRRCRGSLRRGRACACGGCPRTSRPSPPSRRGSGRSARRS